MEKGDDLSPDDIVDVGGASWGEKKAYSHEQLVMVAMGRIAETGAHEMREGWMNVKTDQRGNTVRTYIEDTRKRHIESIKSAMEILERDYDDTATIKIEYYKSEINKKRKELLKEQNEWWNSLTLKHKQNYLHSPQGGIENSNAFNVNYGWYQLFIEYELELYRKIASELHKLIKRNNDFGEEEAREEDEEEEDN